ncbi:MAG: hypothetical protein H7138_20795, partial [Myxococcales bacterium]|nr:hypothetical protein [Myxococcales bacterium]
MTRGTRRVLPAWIAFTAACGSAPPPVTPGPPIPPPAELTLDSMDVECNGLITALATYAQCPNLHEDDRWDLDAWSERAQQDFAAGKKAAPEPNAQHAIAAACRKATVSVQAATERCNAGPAL